MATTYTANYTSAFNTNDDKRLLYSISNKIKIAITVKRPTEYDNKYHFVDDRVITSGSTYFTVSSDTSGVVFTPIKTSDGKIKCGGGEKAEYWYVTLPATTDRTYTFNFTVQTTAVNNLGTSISIKSKQLSLTATREFIMLGEGELEDKYVESSVTMTSTFKAGELYAVSLPISVPEGDTIENVSNLRRYHIGFGIGDSVSSAVAPDYCFYASEKNGELTSILAPHTAWGNYPVQYKKINKESNYIVFRVGTGCTYKSFFCCTQNPQYYADISDDKVDLKKSKVSVSTDTVPLKADTVYRFAMFDYTGQYVLQQQKYKKFCLKIQIPLNNSSTVDVYLSTARSTSSITMHKIGTITKGQSTLTIGEDVGWWNQLINLFGSADAFSDSPIYLITALSSIYVERVKVSLSFDVVADTASQSQDWTITTTETTINRYESSKVTVSGSIKLYVPDVSKLEASISLDSTYNTSNFDLATFRQAVEGGIDYQFTIGCQDVKTSTTMSKNVKFSVQTAAYDESDTVAVLYKNLMCSASKDCTVTALFLPQLYVKTTVSLNPWKPVSIVYWKANLTELGLKYNDEKEPVDILISEDGETPVIVWRPVRLYSKYKPTSDNNKWELYSSKNGQ